MAGCSHNLFLLSIMGILSLKGLVFGRYTCYSCTGEQLYQGSCSYISVEGASTVKGCSYGCLTQITANFTGFEKKKITRGCATKSSADGCLFDAGTGKATCSSICSSSNCNGDKTTRNLECYQCDSETNEDCERVNSWTESTYCLTGGCYTITTKSSSGRIVNVKRDCAGYVIPGSYSYPTGSKGDTVYVSMCNRDFCNDVNQNLKQIVKEIL